MKILFRLAWFRKGFAPARAFKSKAAFLLVEDFRKRIGHFCPCQILENISPQAASPRARVWICDRGPGSRMLASEEVAQRLERLQVEGVGELNIVLGGPDGFSKDELEKCKPDLLWSFGPLTLPHEMAAVVAAEQIYRAWTILRGLPYHKGH